MRSVRTHLVANTAILLAQFGQDGPTMPSLAADILAELPGVGATAAQVDAARAAFQARGIL